MTDSVESISGPSFPKAIQWVATLFMLVFICLAIKIIPTHPLVGCSWPIYVGFILPIAIFFFGYGYILRSQTSLTNEKIVQSWFFKKEVELKDITQLKLIQLHSLNWMIVPRLIVRTHRGVFVFQTADQLVLENFRQLAYGIKTPKENTSSFGAE